MLETKYKILIITLYRAVSQYEKDDFDIDGIFRTGENTLEVKQFFGSRTAVDQYVQNSVKQNYTPPYRYLLIIRVTEECLNHSNSTFMLLDGFNALCVAEADSRTFSNCVIFIKEEVI